MKYDFVIGIDPDVSKSGVAEVNLSTREAKVQILSFPDLLKYLLQKKEEYRGRAYVIVVEAGWLVKKSNFHGSYGRRAERIAKDVGSNHETGRKIVEMCQSFEMNTVEQRPLRKIWSGQNGKISHEEIKAFAQDIGSRSNQEERDALLLAWCFAGLPIRLSVGKNFKKN